MILSDLMFFLSESNQKYAFFSQDNKVRNHAIFYWKSSYSLMLNIFVIVEKKKKKNVLCNL